MVNVRDFGALGDGTHDDQPAMVAAITAAIATTPQGTVWVPRGNYLLNEALDFSTILGSTELYEFSFLCEFGTQFQQGSSSMSYLVNLEASGNQLLACRFAFGALLGMNQTSVTTNGLRVRYLNDSFLSVLGCHNFAGGSGILFDQVGTPSYGIFNNVIRILRLTGNKQGFVTTGNTSSQGFQGNLVQVAHVIQSGSDGVVVDSNGTGLNSFSNTFMLGAVEHSGGAGVIDNNGLNSWLISNTNSNTNGGFVLPTGTVGTPWVVGVIQDSVNLNGNKARMQNFNATPGSVAAPSVPSSGVAQANTFTTPVRVFVSGGTVTNVAVDGAQTGLTSGAFLLNPGETITLTYSVAPTWTWIAL